MILRYYTKSSTIFLCYDNDEAGLNKGRWLTEEFTKKGARCVLWKYRGKDPNRVWQLGGDSLLRQRF